MISFPGIVYLVPLPPIPKSGFLKSTGQNELIMCFEDREYPGKQNEISLTFTKPKDDEITV